MKLNVAKINTELQRLGWSQAKFADEIGVSRQFVNKILNGEAGRTFAVADKIAATLGIEAKDLIIS